MKRFHVHVAVPDLAESVRFYSKLFGCEPTVTKDDYAKWMLEDPRVNFAISQRGASVGINHLGFQVDSDGELLALHAQLESADRAVLAEQGANCCYARSNKYWITDPAGIAWESFHTLGSSCARARASPSRPSRARSAARELPVSAAADGGCAAGGVLQGSAASTGLCDLGAGTGGRSTGGGGGAATGGGAVGLLTLGSS